MQVIGYVDSDGNITTLDGCTPATNLDCECDGGMVELSIKYNGLLTNANIQVINKDDIAIYSGIQSTNGEFTFIGLGKENRMTNTIYFEVNGVVVGELHVSCSQPLYIGLIIGDFEIVGGISRNNGQLCTSTYKQSNPKKEMFTSKAYPNPSGSEFDISVNTDNTKDKVTIQVFDIRGNLILSDKFKSTKHYKFGSRLKTGLYYVRLTQPNNVSMLKLIKN